MSRVGQDGGLHPAFRLAYSPPPSLPGLDLEAPIEEEEDSIQYLYDRGFFGNAEAEANTRAEEGEEVGTWLRKIRAASRIQQEIESFKLEEIGTPIVPLSSVEKTCRNLARTVEGHAAIAWANQILQRSALRWLTKTYPKGFRLGSDILVDRVIERGGTCIVFEVQRPDSSPWPYGEVSRKMACKKLQSMNGRDYHFDFQNEIDVLSYLKDTEIRHIVRYQGVFAHGQEPCILMSPVAQQDLSMYLADNVELQNSGDWERTLETRDQLFEWMLCLARTLAEFHGQGILHRDIRPANILLWYSKNLKYNTIMFADFGVAFRAGSDLVEDESQIRLGDMYYAAPEIQHLYERDGFGASGPLGDVFALGCVFYEMLGAWLHASATATSKVISMEPHELPSVPIDGKYSSSIQDQNFVHQARTMRVGWNFSLAENYMRDGSVERMIGIVLDMMLSTPRSTAAEVAGAILQMMNDFQLYPGCGSCS